jgi:hypothetical protein
MLCPNCNSHTHETKFFGKCPICGFVFSGEVHTVKVTGLPYGNEMTYTRDETTGCFMCTLKSGIDGSIVNNLYPITQEDMYRIIRLNAYSPEIKMSIE